MTGLAFLAGMLTGLVLALLGAMCLLGMQAAEQRITNLDRGPVA